MVALPQALIQDVEQLAKKVAQLGDPHGMDAVVIALRDYDKRLARVRRAEALRAAVDEFQASLLDRSVSSEQAQDELYDEHGLPK